MEFSNHEKKNNEKISKGIGKEIRVLGVLLIISQITYSVLQVMSKVVNDEVSTKMLPTSLGLIVVGGVMAKIGAVLSKEK